MVIMLINDGTDSNDDDDDDDDDNGDDDEKPPSRIIRISHRLMLRSSKTSTCKNHNLCFFVVVTVTIIDAP